MVSDIQPNPWDNAYWFARMLINSDKYGGIGANSAFAENIASVIGATLTMRLNEEDRLALLATAIKQAILGDTPEGSRQGRLRRRLWEDLQDNLRTIRDYEVLALTCSKIMVPINAALKKVPNDDRVYAESFAKALLDAKGAMGLATIISMWDELGSAGCIRAEREEVVSAFRRLRDYVSENLSLEDADIVLSAFCQEFERRLGQKRKGRAGGSVENVTNFILNYYRIKASNEPEHFTAGLEIDQWVRGKDGWYIGMSCKRTLRERWKQAYTTDTGLLDRHRIRSLWHLITYDRDLSDDKITEMGSHRAVLYLPDDSPRLRYAVEHPGLRNYVRPLSSFVDEIQALL